MPTPTPVSAHAAYGQRVPGTRMPLIVTTVGCIGIVALGWFLGAAPALDAAAVSRESLASTEAQNVLHRATLVTLAEQHSRLDSLRADVAGLRREVPAGLHLPDLVDQISAVASTHGVVVTHYQAEEPVSPLAIAVPPQPAAITDPAAAQPSASDATATAPAASSGPSGTGPQPTTPSTRLTATNLFAVPITLTLTGTAADARAVLGDLQHGQRLFFVTSAKIVADSSSPGGASEVRGYAYVLTGSASG